MSLGSEYPELLDEAFQDAITAKVFSYNLKTWQTADQRVKMEEDIKYALSEMSFPTKETEGYYLIYQYLCDGVGSDALDRFHEHFRG